MNYIKKYTFYISILVVGLFGCTDPVSIDVGKGEQALVVEGNVVYNPQDSMKQFSRDTVKLSMSIDFTDQSTAPPKIDNAFLTITDHMNLVDTLKSIGDGKYITQKLIPKMFGTYRLDIRLANGEKYYATSKINRSPIFADLSSVDTVRTLGPGGAIPAGGFVRMRIYDLPGAGDSYRLKYYVKRNPVASNPYYVDPQADGNWKAFNKVANFVIVSESINADNQPNSGISEGRFFLLPIAISPNLVGENPRTKPAYYPGDSIRVEVYSITLEHIFFYYRLKQELSNGTGGGFSGLFSRPSANLPTNILAADGSGKKALGWFGASSLVRKDIKMVNFEFKESPATARME